MVFQRILILCSIMVVCISGQSSMPEVPTPGNSNPEDHVLIIGAGAAGMCAAYTLEYLGVNYTLLEANTDFGGRVQQIPAGEFLDVPLDLGAEWLVFYREENAINTLQDLLLFEGQTFDEPLIDYRPQEIYSFSLGKRRWHNWMQFFYREHKFYNSTWYSYFEDNFFPYIATNTKFNAVVNSVDYSNTNNIVVSTEDGRKFYGTKVIMAVPVTVMQSDDINFTPPLSEQKQRAINSIVMPPGFKVLMEFDEKFYADMQFSNNLLVSALVETPFYFDGVFKKPTNRHMCTLLQVGGPGALERAQLSDEDLVEDVINELDAIYDGKASEHFIKSYVQNWYKNKYIRGTYPEDRIPCPVKNTILEPIDDSIYFSGDYLPYEKGWQSMVHVAAISGRSAAVTLYNAMTSTRKSVFDF